MNPLFKATRSVAVEFLKSIYISASIVASVTAIILISGSIWLTSLSDWWWILAIFIIGVSILAAALIVGVGFLIRFAAPARTKQQKQQSKALAEKVQRVAEVSATPRIFLLFQVAKDVVLPSERGFIASVSEDAVSLKRDFKTLRDSFDV